MRYDNDFWVTLMGVLAPGSAHALPSPHQHHHKFFGALKKKSHFMYVEIPSPPKSIQKLESHFSFKYCSILHDPIFIQVLLI